MLPDDSEDPSGAEVETDAVVPDDEVSLDSEVPEVEETEDDGSEAEDPEAPAVTVARVVGEVPVSDAPVLAGTVGPED